MRLILASTVLALVAALASAPADARVRNVTDPGAPRALPEQGPVSVRWTDPAQFTDLRYSGNRWEAQRGNWVAQLAEHVRQSTARRLPAGERLDIEITDIRRAGDYEPWRGIDFDRIRVVRELYPPRMSLRFTRTAADGSVLAQGERELRDFGFLMTTPTGFSGDALRYEKHMIERWAQREFGPRQAAR